MKKLITILVVVFTLLLIVASVSAAPPEISETDFDVTWTVVDSCEEFGFGDFEIKVQSVGTEVSKTFFDVDGNIVKETEHLTGTDHVYREGFPENFATGHFSDVQTFTYDPLTGELISEKFTGNPYSWTLPGHGNVYHIAGPLFIDPDGVRAAGLFVEDYVSLCSYFSS